MRFGSKEQSYARAREILEKALTNDLPFAIIALAPVPSEGRPMADCLAVSSRGATSIPQPDLQLGRVLLQMSRELAKDVQY